MLAEIFMLRLEADARRAQGPVDARFVPFNPAIRIEFRDRPSNRATKTP